MTFVVTRRNRRQVDGLPESIIADAVREMEYAKGHLQFEEDFNALVQAYIDIEQRSLAAALGNIVRRNSIAEDPHEQIAAFNAHMSALIFSARAYVDKTSKWLSKAFGARSPERKAFDEGRRNEHSASFSFKLMEALRNHAQHAGNAISGLSTPQTKSPERSVTSCSPTVSRDVLLQEKEFAKIADELRRKPRSYPILPSVRCYVASMGRVHESLRNALQSRLTKARGAILLPMYRADIDDGVLLVTELDESSNEVASYSIWATVLHRIERLRTRNSSADYSKLAVQTFDELP